MDIVSAQNIPSSRTFDHQQLLKAFLAVNKKHFQNQINASIRWEVPKGTVSVANTAPSFALQSNSKDAAYFERAKRLIGQSKLLDAVELLEHLAAKNHTESQLLLSHILKRTGGNWQRWADRYNRNLQRTKLVPAACYYPESQSICIHPHLHERKVPQFVLRYLIYHECCHQLLSTYSSDPHPPEFMVLENAAPHRDRALLWLEKEGFPTLSD